MVYTVTLNPALDYYMRVNELRADVQVADSTSIDFGGKGINVSAILSRLGIETTALGFAGGFTGEKLCSLLSEEGIACDFVEIEGETRINVKIDGAEEIIVNARGASVSPEEEQRLAEKLSALNDGDYLVLAGSVPPSMGSSAYERLLGSVKSKGVKLVADTSGEALISLLTHKPFLVKPNNFELEELLGEKLATRDDYVSGAKHLQSMGAENVLVSLGKNGMLLLTDSGEIFEEPIIEGKVKNTTGCGDSTVAGFIAGIIRTGDYKKALHLASICANATAFSDRLATADEIRELAEKLDK